MCGRPVAVCVAVVLLGLIGLIQFVVGVATVIGPGRGSDVTLISGIIGAGLAVALYRRHRWAWVVTILCGLGGMLTLKLGIMIGNALVLIPLIVAWRWFWKPDLAESTSGLSSTPAP